MAIKLKPGFKVLDLKDKYYMEIDTVEKERIERLFELGPAFGSGFELKRGPSPGTRLVKNPVETLADGQGVKEKVAK